MLENGNKFILTEADKKDINHAKTFRELVIIGLRLISRMKQPVVQVCGPISTGGSGSVKDNLKSLSKTIRRLSNDGLSVFNQLPFERAFNRIMKNYKTNGYDTPILKEFYKPIFDSGKIKRIYLLPGWQRSVGSKWEYNYAKKLGIKTILL